MKSISYEKKEAKEAADLLKIVSSGVRLRIMDLLLRNKEGLCVYEIAEAIGMSQSATSHQLAKLADHGIVACDREGKTMCYRVCRCEKASALKRVLKTLRSGN